MKSLKPPSERPTPGLAHHALSAEIGAITDEQRVRYVDDLAQAWRHQRNVQALNAWTQIDDRNGGHRLKCRLGAMPKSGLSGSVRGAPSNGRP